MISRQSLARSERLRRAVLPSRQAFACADPERTVRTSKERMDVVPGQYGIGGLVENLKSDTVKSHQPHFGAEPHEPVTRLHEGLNRVLRQSIFHDPRLSAVAG